MQDDTQFEQLMLQYQQLSNGSDDIKTLIEKEHYDDAITYIKSRETIFMNCKNMRKFLEFTPEQETKLNNILEELRTKENANIELLKTNMATLKTEMKQNTQTSKIQFAYDIKQENAGEIINVSE